MTDLGDARLHGKTVRRLAVTAAGAAPLDVLVDPQRALPVAVAESGGPLIVEFSDFRTVGGLRLPFEVVRRGGSERFATRTVSPDALSAPVGIVPAFDGPSSAVAFHRPEDARDANQGQPVVPCTLADLHVLCLIDTGNSGLGISLELAERLNLEPSGEFEVAGLGSYVTGLVSAGPLRVGNATFPTAKYVVLHDLRAYGYDVVLGADAFAHALVTIDYAASTVTFAPESTGSSAATIPISFQNFVPVVTAQLGAFDVPLAIDTGDVAAVNVSQAYYRDHPGLFTPRSTRQVSGIGGTSVQVVGEVPSVRLATFDVSRQPIAATGAKTTTANGHLGSAFLAHFTLVLDYARARIGLVPRKSDAAVRVVN